MIENVPESFGKTYQTLRKGVADVLSLNKALEEGVFTDEDAILCRNTKPLIEMAYRLIREGTACRVEGRSIGEGLIRLVTRWKKVKTIAALEEKLREWEEVEMSRAMDRGNNDRCSVVEDQVGTLLVLIENCDRGTRSTFWFRTFALCSPTPTETNERFSPSPRFTRPKVGSGIACSPWTWIA